MFKFYILNIYYRFFYFLFFIFYFLFFNFDYDFDFFVYNIYISMRNLPNNKSSFIVNGCHIPNLFHICNI